MNLKNPAIVAADQALYQARQARARIVYQEVCACAHSEVGECDFKDETILFHAQPPERVCLACGLMESGWGSGYSVLRAEPVQKLSREDAYSLRTVRITNDDKGPLARKEKTMAYHIAKELGLALEEDVTLNVTQ